MGSGQALIPNAAGGHVAPKLTGANVGTRGALCGILWGRGGGSEEYDEDLGGGRSCEGTAAMLLPTSQKAEMWG